MHLLMNGVDSLLRGTSEGAANMPQPRRRGPTGGTSSVKGFLIDERPELRLVAYGDSIYTLPAFEYATQLYDTPRGSACSRFRSWRLLVVTFLFGVQQIEIGTLQYVTEMRIISVSFASGSGFDVMSLNGPLQSRTHGSFWE